MSYIDLFECKVASSLQKFLGKYGFHRNCVIPSCDLVLLLHLCMEGLVIWCIFSLLETLMFMGF